MGKIHVIWEVCQSKKELSSKLKEVEIQHQALR